MDTLLLPKAGRSRRRYSPEFKTRIVAACQQPGASTTAIAVANQINPNVVRRWIRNHKLAQDVHLSPDATCTDTSASQTPRPPALVPVEMAVAALRSGAPVAATRINADVTGSPRLARSSCGPVSMPPPGDPIRLELRQGETLLNVAWPSLQADACALWLRELLR
jgi:transposase-like protein